MTATVINGREAASRVHAEVALEVADLVKEAGRPPGLATILVGDDPASEVYVRNKRKVSAEVGIVDHHRHLAYLAEMGVNPGGYMWARGTIDDAEQPFAVLVSCGLTAALLARLYEHDAPAFAAFGASLRIHAGRVRPPGGEDAVPLWEAAVHESVTNPDAFVRALFSLNASRIAYLYDTIGQLDAPAAAFALGSWMPDPAARISRFGALVAR